MLVPCNAPQVCSSKLAVPAQVPHRVVVCKSVSDPTKTGVAVTRLTRVIV